MRFRLGLVIGFGSGYYLGSMAGRERYEQINRTLSKLKRSEAYETASEKVHEAVDTGVAKAKDVVQSVRPDGNDNGPSGYPGGNPLLRPGSELP